jgi:tripartite-type tricarboxylate transporter receptor subunit TctC
VLAPAGTPKPVIDRLHAEIVKALNDPGVQQRLDDYEIFGSTPEEFGAFIRADIEKTAPRAPRSTTDASPTRSRTRLRRCGHDRSSI